MALILILVIIFLVAYYGSLAYSWISVLLDNAVDWQLRWDYKYPPYHDQVDTKVDETEITDHLFENPIQHMNLD